MFEVPVLFPLASGRYEVNPRSPQVNGLAHLFSPVRGIDGPRIDMWGGLKATNVAGEVFAEPDPDVGARWSFDGAGDALTFPTPPTLVGASEFTLAAWMRRRTTFDYVTSHSSFESTNNRVEINFWNDGRLYMVVCNDGNRWCYTDINDTDWHLIIGRYDGNGATNADRARIWIDGTEQTLSYGGGDFPTTSPSSINDDDYNIGLSLRSTTYSDGFVADSRIYEKALTESAIEQIYSNPFGIYRPVNRFWFGSAGTTDLSTTVNFTTLNLSEQPFTVVLPPPPQTAVSPETLALSPQPFIIQPGTAETAVLPETLALSPQPLTVQPGTAETAVNPALLNLSPQPLTVALGTPEYETVINPATLNLNPQTVTIDLPDAPQTAVNPATLNLIEQAITVDLPDPPQTAVNPTILTLTPQPFAIQTGTAETAINPTALNLSPQPFTVVIPDAQQTAVNPATLNLSGQALTVTGGVLPLDTTINPVGLSLSPQQFGVEVVVQPQDTTINPAVLNLSPHPVVIYNPGEAILIGDATPLPLGVDSITLTDHILGEHQHEIVSSSNPGADAVILQTDVNGYLQLERLGIGVAPTEALDVAGNIQLTGVLQHVNDLVIDPTGGDVLLRTADLAAENWVSGTTGWGVTYDGNADFRNITADSLTVEAFISDINLALAGSQIITKSLAILSRNFTIPSGNATLYVYDLPGFENTTVFADGDYVRLRFINIGTGLVVGDAWGTVDLYTDLNDGEQSWRWTRVSGSVGEVIHEGTTALDYGQSGDGYWHVTTLDPAGSPYAEIGTWATVPANHTIHTRLGQLDGIAGLGDEWGLWAGQDAQHYLVASDTNLEAHGMRISLYDGVFERIRLDPTVPSLAIGDPLPTSLTVGDGLWAGKHTNNDFHLRIGKALAQRLEWDSNDITLYDSSNTPMIVLDASGESYFAGAMTIGASGGIWQGTGSFASPVTGLKLWNDGGIGRLAGYEDGTLQAEFATDGKIKAAAGAIVLGQEGLVIRPDGSTPAERERIRFGNSLNLNTEIFGSTHGLFLKTTNIFSNGKVAKVNIFTEVGGNGDAIIELDADQTNVTKGLKVGSDPYTPADGWMIIKGNIEARRGITVNGLIQANQGQISIGDDLILGGNIIHRYGSRPLDYRRLSSYVQNNSYTDYRPTGHAAGDKYVTIRGQSGVPSTAVGAYIKVLFHPSAPSSIRLWHWIGSAWSPVDYMETNETGYWKSVSGVCFFNSSGQIRITIGGTLDQDLNVYMPAYLI